MRRVLALSIILAGAASAAMADEVNGSASVVDSDIIKIGNQRIILVGMESVDRNQTCSVDGRLWQCYAAAVRQLEILVDEGPVTCMPEEGRSDPYGRIFATCEVAGKNLNELYVSTGMAVARRDESEAYAAAEQKARDAGIGLWQSEFDMPWDHRIKSGIFVDRP